MYSKINDNSNSSFIMVDLFFSSYERPPTAQENKYLEIFKGTFLILS